MIVNQEVRVLTLALLLFGGVRGADCGREIGSAILSNCSLGSIECADEVAGDGALSLESIGKKGRRCCVGCCVSFGGIVGGYSINLKLPYEGRGQKSREYSAQAL